MANTSVGWVLLVLLSGCGTQAQDVDHGAAGAVSPPCDLSASLRRDRDGDGYGDPNDVEVVCLDNGRAPTGFQLLGDPDCDDTDSSVFVERYPDVDGDGFGDHAAAGICGTGSTPLGFASNDTDCDDGDATRNPDATEQWQDGVDSDCDGHDDPIDCAQSPTSCDCPVILSPPMASVAAGCADQADLFIERLVVCFDCGSPTEYFTIGNRGGVSAQSGATAIVSREGTPATVAFPVAALAPGEVGLPVRVPTGGTARVTVELAGPAGPDCDPSNDSATVQPSVAECK